MPTQDVEKGWEVVSFDNGEIHVKPQNDLLVHFGTDCWCKPSKDDDAWVHHAADCREETENE